MRPALIRPFFALASAAALASCGDEPAPEVGDDDARAEGEVLGGTISDDMLPLDQRKSQSPTLKEAGTATTTSGSTASDTDAAVDAEPEAQPEPEPDPQPEPLEE